MTLICKGRPYIIPEYNLTGDLLGYLQCGLLYRYTRRGLLPPSRPVQLWFGEFLHGTMAEAYLRWKEAPDAHRFPWDWQETIHEIEIEVYRRLLARGLAPTPQIFCPFREPGSHGRCHDAEHPHKLLASRLVDAAINTWGPHLFPLIDGTEVPLKGCRSMPTGIDRPRSSYFGVTGVVDVISSVNLERAPPGNLILRYLNDNESVRSLIQDLGGDEYEIIIDYKGMRRPGCRGDEPGISDWMAHQWQILTYAWLRSRQQQSRPPIAGILFYLNELIPSQKDIDLYRGEVARQETDIVPTLSRDQAIIAGMTTGVPSSDLRERRSIRIVPITPALQTEGLRSFDRVVAEIETAIGWEQQMRTVSGCWPTRFREKTCTNCDFMYSCPDPNLSGTPREVTVP